MGRLAEQFKTTVTLEILAAQYGKEWEDAYIDVAPLTVKALPAFKGMKLKKGAKDLEEMNDEQLATITKMLKMSFVGGKVVLNGELVDAEAEDLEDLPFEAMNLVIEGALGKPDPKPLES